MFLGSLFLRASMPDLHMSISERSQLGLACLYLWFDKVLALARLWFRTCLQPCFAYHVDWCDINNLVNCWETIARKYTKTMFGDVSRVYDRPGLLTSYCCTNSYLEIAVHPSRGFWWLSSIIRSKMCFMQAKICLQNFLYSLWNTDRNTSQKHVVTSSTECCA